MANEEAEKRLKAALTAKREPVSSASRVASPNLGNPSTPEPSGDVKPSIDDQQLVEDAPMEVDSTSAIASAPEASLGGPIFLSKKHFFNSGIAESMAPRPFRII